MAEAFTKFSEYGVEWIFIGALSNLLRVFSCYFMRLEFAAPLFVGQFALLLLISAIFSHLPKRPA